MEFTYDGLVRHGFGFQNPNHAAALLTLLLPWLWAAAVRVRATWMRLLWVALSWALLLPLVLTFSRTGAAVLAGEALLFFALYAWMYRPAKEDPPAVPPLPTRRTVGLWAAATLMVFAGLTMAAGSQARLTDWVGAEDRAVNNRFLIWRGGLELYAANPGGVGGGNSGLLYTAFLAPEGSGIVCRTLINSFLTFLVEYGALWGGVLAWGLCFAALGGLARLRATGSPQPLAALCTLAAGIVSGLLSTCYDPEFWFASPDAGATPLARSLSVALVLLFLGQAFYLILSAFGLPRRRAFVGLGLSAGLALIVLAGLYGAGRWLSRETSVRVINAGGDRLACYRYTFTKKAGERFPAERTLALYDRRWSLPQVAKWWRRHGDGALLLPLQPWDTRPYLPETTLTPNDTLLLFGRCGTFAEQRPDLPATLVSPPEGLPRPANLHRLHLRRFIEETPWPDDEPPEAITWY